MDPMWSELADFPRC